MPASRCRTWSVAFWRDVLGLEVVSVGALPDETILERITGIAGARGGVAFVSGPGLLVELIEYTSPEERGTAGRPSASPTSPSTWRT